MQTTSAGRSRFRVTHRGWVLTLLVLVALGTGHTVAQSPGTVLLVTGDIPSAGDLVVQQRLEVRHGYTVVRETAMNTTSGSATGKAAVLISSSASASQVGIKFQTVLTPVVCWNSGVFSNLKMTGTGTPAPNTAFGTQPHYSEVVISDPNHSMAAGLEGVVTMTSAPGPFTWGYAPGARVMVQLGIGRESVGLCLHWQRMGCRNRPLLLQSSLLFDEYRCVS
jgi:hypothetical protein